MYTLISIKISVTAGMVSTRNDVQNKKYRVAKLATNSGERMRMWRTNNLTTHAVSIYVSVA